MAFEAIVRRNKFDCSSLVVTPFHIDESGSPTEQYLSYFHLCPLYSLPCADSVHSPVFFHLRLPLPLSTASLASCAVPLSGACATEGGAYGVPGGQSTKIRRPICRCTKQRGQLLYFPKLYPNNLIRDLVTICVLKELLQICLVVCTSSAES